MRINYNYEEFGLRLWPRLPGMHGIAGRVTAYNFAYLGFMTRGKDMEYTRPAKNLGATIRQEAKKAEIHLFTVACKAIHAYANYIIDFGGTQVIPCTYPAHRWPSLVELEQPKDTNDSRRVGGVSCHAP